MSLSFRLFREFTPLSSNKSLFFFFVLFFKMVQLSSLIQYHMVMRYYNKKGSLEMGWILDLHLLSYKSKEVFVSKYLNCLICRFMCTKKIKNNWMIYTKMINNEVCFLSPSVIKFTSIIYIKPRYITIYKLINSKTVGAWRHMFQECESLLASIHWIVTVKNKIK